MAKGLNKDILQKLVRRTGNSESSIRVSISEIRRRYAGLTLNAAAQIYAQKKKISVMQKLDREDRESLASVPIQLQTFPIQVRNFSKKRPSTTTFLRWNWKDRFQERHLAEINRAHGAGCYMATFVLCRKMVENLIIDLLLKRFPEKNQKNRGLYFNLEQKRFHDFSIILDNLHKKRSLFPATAIKPIERLHTKAKPFAKEVNDHIHSWFYITSKKELDDINVQEMFDLIQAVDSLLINR